MKTSVKKIVFSAFFAAVICILTFTIKVPSINSGYLNLGDAVCLVSAWSLGPVAGALSSAVGSAAADIIGGYAFYAPATFIIKALAYFFAGLIFIKLKSKAGLIFSALIGEAITIVGYFIFEWLYLQNFAAALLSCALNGIQAIFGIACGIILYKTVLKTKIFDKHKF